MISICVATRKRPWHFHKLCSTALGLADNPTNIEIVSYHDDDDTSEYKYIGNHKEIFGKRDIGIFKMANECQKIATGPIYMFTADDFYFETKRWDVAVEAVFDSCEDKILFVCPNGAFWEKWKFGVVGFLHKEWVDTVGYLLPPYHGGQAADLWINEMAVAINRRVRLFDLIVNHSNCKDEVHREKNRQGLREEWRKSYYLPEVVVQRKLDTEKLRSRCLQPV
jgi:hypothetical protein